MYLIPTVGASSPRPPYVETQIYSDDINTSGNNFKDAGCGSNGSDGGSVSCD